MMEKVDKRSRTKPPIGFSYFGNTILAQSSGVKRKVTILKPICVK